MTAIFYGYTRHKSHATGEKRYFATIDTTAAGCLRTAKRYFKTATDAEIYGIRAARLYNSIHKESQLTEA